MTELPRHPRHNTLRRGGGSANYGRARLFDVLIKYQLWDEALQLCHLPYLEVTDKDDQNHKRLGLLGAAYFMTRRAELGNELIADLQSQIDGLEQTIEEKVATAREEAQESGKEDEDIDKAGEEAKKRIDDKVKKIAKVRDLLEGFRLLNDGDAAGALENLKSGGYSDKGFLAEVQFRAGEVDEALKDAARQVDRGKGEVIPLARLCFMQAEAERWDDARQSFEKLQEISSSIDMRSDLFRRLKPVAEHLGLSSDWRLPLELADDIGQRADLDDLGPFRWSPSPAPEWQLPNADGITRSSKEFQGKPVILIFYLGYGCLHCAEQLHAFAPQIDQFEEAGISLLAVSTDSVLDLKQSIDDYEGGLPIPLVSDESLNVFRAFRAFDDFEAQALHGTFLIDGNGLVRWHDISYEPFMDHEFLLEEAQRLLAQDQPPVGQVSQPDNDSNVIADSISGQ